MKYFFDRRAFTLAELMAVVVIISILAGIAIGSYNKSVRRAQFTDMKSLAHQVAAARDTYYYDRLSFGETGTMPTQFDQLMLEVDGCTGVSSCRINNFTVNISNAGYVTAKHADGYGLRVYQEAGVSGRVTADKCCGDVDFCTSMGYESSDRLSSC